MTTTDRLVTINEVHDNHEPIQPSGKQVTRDRVWAEMNEKLASPPEPQQLIHWILGPINPANNLFIDFEQHNAAFNEAFERAEKAITLLREREAAAGSNLNISTDTIEGLESLVHELTKSPDERELKVRAETLERAAAWLESNGQPGYAVEIRNLKL